ncbi:hypothetical protein BJX65DRAFT_302672 [Aspergillus insuetus]
MKLLIISTLLAAATALALPTEHPGTGTETSTTETQDGYTCGRAQLACCPDQESTSISREEEDSLLNLLGGSDVLANGVLGRYRGCSGLASLQSAVGGQCNNNAACCDAGDTELNGLVNVAIPCLPINLPVL